MAKEKQKKDYKYYESVIKAALKYRDKIICDEDFKVYSNYYKGRFHKDKKKTNRVDVNLVFSTTNLLMSALAAKDPWIAFKSRKEEYKSREQICEESLNNTLQDLGFKDTLQLNIRDTQLYGYGLGKCGYAINAEVEEKKSAQSAQPEYDLHIKKDSVYFKLIDSKKILLDPTGTEGLSGSKIVIEILIQSKSYLEEQYGIDLSRVAAGIPTFLKDKYDDLDKESQKLFDMCVYYEIWDIVDKTRRIMIEGYTDEVFRFEWPKALIDEQGEYEYPYEMLIFNHAPNEPYGISDVGLYRSQQEELNTLRSFESEAVKKNSPKWQAVSDGVEIKEIRKFMANETGTIVSVKQPNAITPIMPHQLSQDSSIYEARIKNDVQETMGVNDAMRGGSTGKKTATEAYSSDFFAKLRIGSRQNEVDKFTLRVASKLFRFMQAEYDSPRYVRLVGKEGAVLANQYTNADLDGEYDKTVQQGTGAQNKAYLAQAVAKGLELLNGNPLINPKEFTEIIIDVFFDGIDTSKLMIPNAEEIANDPIEREKWRQLMILVQQKNMIQQATQPAQLPGGSPIPGNMPEQGMQAPAVAGV